MKRLELIDRLSGKSTADWLAHYRETEHFAPDVMQRYQTQKLRRVLRQAAEHVPFYRDALAAAGVRVDDVTGLDVLQRLPVIDKTQVRENYQAFVPDNLSEMPNLRVLQTGGTTGEPLRFPVDPQRRSSVWAAMYRYYGWMGVQLGDPILVIWGAPVVRSGWKGLKRRARDFFLHRLENQVWMDSFGLSSGRLEDYVQQFTQHRPVLVRGYCQSLYELARMFRRAGFSYPLQAVSATVEPLFDEYRDLFREVFECEAFDQYGCGEVESVAFECEAHQGLHIAEERCVVETDAEGRIILTDLDNLAFPLLRYMPGDQVELAPEGPCACGRQSRRIRRILGRTGDVVVAPNGARLHPEFFTHLLNESGVSFARNLTRYQVVQTSPTTLQWMLVCDELTEEDETVLGQVLEKYLHGMTWSIREVDDIPLEGSGKFRYVRSLLQERDRGE